MHDRNSHRLLFVFLVILAVTAVTRVGRAEAQCAATTVRDPAENIAAFPPLYPPFRFGQSWTVGGGGSFFGHNFHNNCFSDYYATDWNRTNDAGEPVFPVAAGVVIEKEVANCGAAVGGLGCYVVLEHRLGTDGERIESTYAHLQAHSSDHLEPGDIVMPWTQIGRVGNTGTNASHLHLSLKSYTGTDFVSRCNSPAAKGSDLCPNGEQIRAPQSRRPRWMWEAANADQMSRGEVSDRETLSSGNRARLIFPGALVIGGQWDTNFYIRNNSGAPNYVTARFYNGDGGEACGLDDELLGANATWRLSPPSGTCGITTGTVVVQGSSGLDIAGVARVEATSSEGLAFGSYEAVEQPRSRQIVPVVHRKNSKLSSRLFMFNPDQSHTVTAKITLAGAGVWRDWGCDRSVDVDPLHTGIFDTTPGSLATCMPAGWHGSAVIEATYADGTPAVLAITSFEEELQSGRRSGLALQTASGETAERLYVPLVQNGNYGILSGLGIERGVGDGAATVTYRRSGGGHCTTDQYDTLPAHWAPVPQTGATSCPEVVSARIDVPDGTRYVAAQFSQNDENGVSTYPAIARPTTEAYVPYLDKKSLRGIQIYNTATTEADVTIEFYDQLGYPVGETLSRDIVARGFATLVGNGVIPRAARSAKIWADGQRLAVVVNNIMGQGTDRTMDYVAPGRR